MTKQLSVALLLTLLMLVTPSVVEAGTTTFPERVAARCTGEASFAVPECACSVKNRLDAGWAESKVLSAYYAPDVRPTQDAIEVTRKTLAGEIECNKDFYFMFSLQDTIYLGLNDIEPAGKVIRTEGVSEIWLYPRSAWKYVG